MFKAYQVLVNVCRVTLQQLRLTVDHGLHFD